MSEQEVRDFWRAVYLAAFAKGSLASMAKDHADAAVLKLKETFNGY